MNHRQLVTALLILIGAFTALFFGMVLRKTDTAEKPHVVCTTSIIGDIVQTIVHDQMTVHTLMGPGVDPHLYKPIENDIMQIASADIIFYNGLHLEAQMEDVFKKMEYYKTTIAVTKEIPKEQLHASFEYDNHYDPHVWFHIPLWIYTIQTITKTVCAKDPDHAELYQTRAKKYIEQCTKLFQKTKKILHKIPQEKRILITGHDAFQYFAQAYDFEVIGLQGISTESQVGSQDIQQLIDFIVEHQVPAIFIETSTPMRNIQALQEGVVQKGFSVTIGGELFSDALGSIGTPEGTYLGMIKANVQTIHQALTT